MPDIPRAEGSKCTRNNAPGMRLVKGTLQTAEPSPLVGVYSFLSGAEAADDADKAFVSRRLAGIKLVGQLYWHAERGTERADDTSRMLTTPTRTGKLDAPSTGPIGTSRVTSSVAATQTRQLQQASCQLHLYGLPYLPGLRGFDLHKIDLPVRGHSIITDKILD